MNLPHHIRALADSQHGAVTTRQLLTAGMTRRRVHNLVNAGVLRRLHRGVYALGHLAPSDTRRWHAAVLATTPVGALTGHSAGRLLGVSRRRYDRTHVLVSRVRRNRRGISVSFANDFSMVDDTFLHRGIPVTNLGWMLLAMSPDSSQGELARTIREYAHHHHVEFEELRAFIERMHGRPGIDDVRAACAELLSNGGGTDSDFEDDLSDALRDAFPHVTWISNMSITRSNGRSFRLDNFCPVARLCVEGDPSHHGFVLNRLDDLRRDSELDDERHITTIRIHPDTFYADRATAFLPVAAHLARTTNGAHAVTFV